jgi:3-deoxy-manno-octulosonate cytidylyltransferase (CMP-KDO synthetase)
MIQMTGKPLVIVPSRLQSARLANKPLQLIGGEPLILHCWRRAVEADIGPVYVASDSTAICDVIERAGGKTIETGDEKSGTDRVAVAAEMVDPDHEHRVVINQQGDMPFISTSQLRHFAAGLSELEDMATAVCPMGLVSVARGDFNRMSVVSHIGLYAFTRAALERFHALPQSAGELEQKLEQLRVVGKMRIRFIEFSHMPQEVNTEEDLAAANALFAVTQTIARG